MIEPCPDDVLEKYLMDKVCASGWKRGRMLKRITFDTIYECEDLVFINKDNFSKSCTAVYEYFRSHGCHIAVKIKSDETHVANIPVDKCELIKHSDLASFINCRHRYKFALSDCTNVQIVTAGEYENRALWFDDKFVEAKVKNDENDNGKIIVFRKINEK